MHLFDRINPVADHRPIIPRADGKPDRFFETVFIQDRAHVEIVRHDQALVAKFFAQ